MLFTSPVSGHNVLAHQCTCRLYTMALQNKFLKNFCMLYKLDGSWFQLKDACFSLSLFLSFSLSFLYRRFCLCIVEMASALATSEVWWPSIPSSMLIFSTIFLALMTLHRTSGKRRNAVHSIPGPYPWPIVGNIFQLGKEPHLVLSEMVNRYGKVFSLKIGSRPVVVLNGLDVLKKALVIQGDDFAERPRLKSMEDISRGQSIVFNKPYNAEWKAYKRLAQNALRTVCSQEAENSECSCALEQHVRSEARYLGQMCIDLTAEHGAFDPTEYLTVRHPVSRKGLICNRP